MRTIFKNIVNILWESTVGRIYRNADVLHCEVIDSVDNRFIELLSVPDCDFDNVASCKYFYLLSHFHHLFYYTILLLKMLGLFEISIRIFS